MAAPKRISLKQEPEENRFYLEMDNCLSEQEWYGNRSYWHGGYTFSDSGVTPLVISKQGPQGTHDEMYFGPHFGYSLAYSLGLKDYNLFGNLRKADELVNSGKMTIPLETPAVKQITDSINKIKRDNNSQNAYHWMVLLGLTSKTKLFHSWNYHDSRWLLDILQNSGNQKMRDFVKFKTGYDQDDFYEAIDPLRTIDWLKEIPSHFPFTRKELLAELRKKNQTGHYNWQGYVNNEKGKYPSIGIFNEHLNNVSLVGPLYRVIPWKDSNGYSLHVERFGSSRNASVPPGLPPNV